MAGATRERELTLDVIGMTCGSCVQRVEKETGGRGCPIVLDAVGGQTFDRSLDCVAVNGRLITIVGTPSPEIPRKLFRKNATLHFEFVGAPTVYGVHPESQGET